MVHVIHQCDGLSKVGHEVDLYLGALGTGVLHEDLLRDFEAEFRSVNLLPVRTGRRHQAFTIAMQALVRTLGQRYDLVLSRNIYFSWMYSQLFQQKVLYETHYVERGVRSWLQKQLIGSTKATTVLSSRKLKSALEEHCKRDVRQAIIVHDAAPEGGRPIEGQKKRIILTGLIEELELGGVMSTGEDRELSLALAQNPQMVTAYFGQLQRGRGIERVIELAYRNKQDVFLVFGEICRKARKLIDRNRVSNLFFAGHVSNGYARRLQSACDILLAPYQQSGAPGSQQAEVGKYMSPIKLFEYMASGTPFIASELPVFDEVIDDGKHTLMVSPEDPEAWARAYRALSSDPGLQLTLANEAHKKYRESFTWTTRARRIIEQSIGGDKRKRAA